MSVKKNSGESSKSLDDSFSFSPKALWDWVMERSADLPNLMILTSGLCDQLR